MSDKSCDEENGKLFYCRICFEKYDSQAIVPFMGECGHSICKVCYEKNFVMRRGKCPWCAQDMGEAKPNKIVIAILERLDQIQAEYIAIQKSVLRLCPEDKNKNGGGPSSSSSEDSTQNASVFVKNIPLNWTLRDLVSYFREFGGIRTNSFGNYHEVNKGLAVIEFSIAEEAHRAIQYGNGRLVDQVLGDRFVERKRITVEPFFGPQNQRKQSNERQNGYPAEAFRQLSMTRMNYVPKR